MEKEALIDNIFLSIKEMRAKCKCCVKTFDFASGWKLEVECFPPGHDDEVDIYFDVMTDGVKPNYWKHDDWMKSDGEEAIRDIIEKLYHFSQTNGMEERRRTMDTDHGILRKEITL